MPLPGGDLKEILALSDPQMDFPVGALKEPHPDPLAYLLTYTYLFKALRAFRHADIIEKEYTLRRCNAFVSEKGCAII